VVYGPDTIITNNYKDALFTTIIEMIVMTFLQLSQGDLNFSPWVAHGIICSLSIVSCYLYWNVFYYPFLWFCCFLNEDDSYVKEKDEWSVTKQWI
jgi:hypothetical protein